MASLTGEKRATLLRALALKSAYAENTDIRIIFPVPEHLRALEADVVLVVGDRGAGKTYLKNALNDQGVREALIHHAPNVHVPPGDVKWTNGWPLDKAGPDSRAWKAFIEQPGRTNDDRMSIWVAYLVRILRDYLPAETQHELAGILNAKGVDASSILSEYRKAGLAVTAALDEIDDNLLSSGRWAFVSYDELDTIVLEDWEAMGQMIRGLVSFWAAYARRWKRLRPKIFLRSDFYRHHRDVAGADVAKISGNRVELQWSDRNLYGALIKHILNKSDASGEQPLREYFSKSIRSQSDHVLGEIPVLLKAIDAKPFVDRLVAEYMGANKGKGLSFRWILDHIRDGNGHAVPRSLVSLVESAADIESSQPRAGGAHLLHHVSVRNALDNVSEGYVLQAKTHELKWLDGLASRLQKDREVPWRRRELVTCLASDFENRWSSENVRPPGIDPDDLLANLVELGVLRERSNDLFDVPDLYLQGLGLRRKGGVARK